MADTPPSDIELDEQHMQSLQLSQPWPHQPMQQLPPSIAQKVNTTKTSSELETLLQHVPEQHLQAFNDLPNQGINTTLIHDHILPSWEASHSASSANTNP
jgi:hypothetical protein